MHFAKLSKSIFLNSVLVLLLLSSSCEEDEILNSVLPATTVNNNEAYFVARAGEDRRILTGDTVVLRALFAENQRNNNFSWRFLSMPEGSLATLTNPDEPVASFLADKPGNYQLELGMSFNQFSAFDTINVAAFTISKLSGEYVNPTDGANGLIRQFLVFRDELFAVGDFIQIGGIPASGVASFDGSRWTAIGEELEMDQVYQVIEFRNKLYISGSSKEIAKDGVRKFASWDGNKWRHLAFSEQGFHMAVYQNNLYLNFGDRLAKWDNDQLTLVDLPKPLKSITHLESANSMLYLRGFSEETCINSNENVWVYNCTATGYFLEFDGTSWSELTSDNQGACLNIGAINWDYHIWIDKEPEFQWSTMTGDLNRLYLPCGYLEDGLFTRYSYPFEKIFAMQLLSDQNLYISGINQKTGNYAGIMKWDKNQWYTLGEGIDGQVWTIEEFRGKLYIGGMFNRPEGQLTGNFTIWEGE
jgi:hypothetical protein